MVDNTSTITECTSQFRINELYHQIAAKDHAATLWVAEAFKTKKVLTLKDIKASPFAEFADVFDEATYQELPPHRDWDHKINLIPGWESKIWKVHTYPLGYQEQKELNAFLEENLKNGRIRR